MTDKINDTRVKELEKHHKRVQIVKKIIDESKQVDTTPDKDKESDVSDKDKANNNKDSGQLKNSKKPKDDPGEVGEPNRKTKVIIDPDLNTKNESISRVINVIRQNSLQESLRHIKTHVVGDHHAKVYKDHENEEYKVKYFKNNIYQPKADHHTDDLEDAHDTAVAGLNHMHKHKLSENEQEFINKLNS